jgi:hypothetical protein
MASALHALQSQVEASLRVPAPFGIRPRPAPELLLTGIAALDQLTGGGLPRGALTELYGGLSSGRTSALHALLAHATAAGEACALLDASDAFDPRSAQAAGADLARLLWVRGDPERINRLKRDPGAHVDQALKAADLLLQAGGFGLVVIDLADVPPRLARRVPLTSWFRFRRAVENTRTVLLVIEQEPFARNSASLVLRLDPTPIALCPIDGSTDLRSDEFQCVTSSIRNFVNPVACLDVRVSIDRALPRRPARSAHFQLTAPEEVA